MASPSLAIPIAIVLGFGLIALSIYLSGGGNQAATMAETENQGEDNTASLEKIAPVTADDHIRGNPNAPIVIVEYSDFDCPYCHSFHTMMQQLMDEYGPGGEVAWVYRHMPLTSLHPSAAHLAEASECVAELGGNEAFWKFADSIFGERTQAESTNVALLPEFAESAGVNVADYEACLDNQRNRAEVEADLENAITVGAQGTPYSVVIAGDQKMPINGSPRSYSDLKLLIDGVLQP